MKKILIISLLLLVLVGCKSDDNTITSSANERYLDLISQLQAREDFKESSEYFDIGYDLSKINNGYRYYITIDNAKVAMYGIEAIAIEKDVDYSTEMAANVGLFEEGDYSFIPGQVYTKEGFVKGINISGVSENSNPTIYLCVIWHNKDLSITHREYFKIDINSEEETNIEIKEETSTENTEGNTQENNEDLGEEDVQE